MLWNTQRENKRREFVFNITTNKEEREERRMKLSSDLYFAFDVIFYLFLSISGIIAPHHIIDLFKLPPTTFRHPELHQFILSLSFLLSYLLAIINLTQAFSFIIALRGDDETKRTVSKVNAFLNIVLSSCFWYNIHYANNPKDDITEHLLFSEGGIASIWFSNMWGVADAFFLLYLGVFLKSNTRTAVITTKNKKN